MLRPETSQPRMPVQTLEEMAEEIYEVNVANGWYEDNRTFGDEIALLHTEVSEMYEAFRDDDFEDTTGRRCDPHDHPSGLGSGNPEHVCKPEGVGSEAADVLIRLLDTCRRRGINLRAEYSRKIAFNRTRGYRHGGKSI